MSWSDHLQKFKDMVVEADPVPTVTVNAKSATFMANSPGLVATIAPDAKITISVEAPVPTDGFLQKLRSHLPPSSVDKFEATLSSLSGVIPDSSMRLNAALSAIKTTAGIEVTQLRDEYNARLNALELQCGQFKTALDAQRNTEVSDRESQITDVTSAIDSKNKEIQALSSKRESLNQEIAAAKNKLSGAQAGFDSAAATVRGEIQDAVSRLGGAA